MGAKVILMGHTASDLAEAAAMRAEGSTTPSPREWAPSPAWPEGRGVFLLRPMLAVSRQQVRDWLHVEDHCTALLAMLERGQPGRTYVVGGNCERANIDIIRRIASEVDALLGKPAGSAAKFIRHVADRPGHDRRYAMNAAVLRRELGWQPRHDLEGALPSVVRWYWENREWAARIRSGAYREYYEKQYGARA